MEEIERADWIEVRDIGNRPLAAALAQRLDDGESEAIALALELKADLVLLDEKDARKAAESLGLNVLGVVGLLIWARRKGIIASLRDELIRLREKAGFRIGEELFNRALEEVGELKSHPP